MKDNELAALLRGGPFDRAAIERLKKIDRQELRAVLGKYLSDEELDGIERRIDELVKTLPGD